MKIAFDIATTTGIVFLDDKNNKLLINDTITGIKNLPTSNNVKMIKKKFMDYKSRLSSKDLKEIPYIGFEVSNFGNPKATQGFSFLSGIFTSICVEVFNTDGTNIKYFTSNQGQRMIGCSLRDTREIRKEKSKKFVIERGIELNSQDEYDAYCIALFLEKIEDTQDIIEKTKEAKKKKILSEKEKIKLQRKVASLLVQCNRLDPIKNKIKRQNLIREMAELGYDYAKKKWN